MRYPEPVLALLFLSSTTLLCAQADLTIRKKDFKNDKSGFEVAWQHVSEGDKYFKQKESGYGNAFEEYEKAARYNNNNPEMNYKAGVSALLSDNKEKAALYLRKVLEIRPDLTDDLMYFAGRALQYDSKFSEAIEKLNSYISATGKKSDEKIAAARKYIGQCESAIEITRDTVRVGIVNAGSSINSNTDDYSEQISSDGNSIFFASRRQLGKSVKGMDNKFDENIFFSGKVNGEWGAATTAGKNITTNYCETPVYLDPNDEELYIYTGYEGGGDIKVSVKKKGEWKTPRVLPFKINTGGMESSLTFSPSGDEVWFVTTGGKNGLGGKDIYFIRKEGDKKWSKPVNAGPSINTSRDEESARFSKGGDTLWFSSTGHNSMGGYDIFRSVRDSTGQWGEAVNAGFPLNTVWDDLFYFPLHNNDSVFYLVSNRAESMGGLDIFEGRYLPPPPVKMVPDFPKPDTIFVRDTIVLAREIMKSPEAQVKIPQKEVINSPVLNLPDSDKHQAFYH